MKMYTGQYTLLETVPAFTIVEAMQQKESLARANRIYETISINYLIAK